MAKPKVRIKMLDDKMFIQDNNEAISKELVAIAKDLLNETGAGSNPDYGYKLLSHKEGEIGRKSRPIVYVFAKGKSGWLEHTRGGPITMIANLRKRFKG